MPTIRQVLEGKGREVWSADPDTTVYDALDLMRRKDIGAVVIIEGQRPIGIFSERDYARKVILEGRASRETPVRLAMSSPVLYIDPGREVEDAMAVMTNRRVRHLPVIEDGELIGLISIGDVVKAIISEQEFMIEQLERYITQ